MKQVEKTMGLLMGLSLSFILSLTGTLNSGAFTLPSFSGSFLISVMISMAVTKIIPMQKISSSFSDRLKLKKGSLSCRLFETLISDLLMSPLMTLIMVFIAYRQATAHGARIPFGPMLIRSEIISFLVAYAALFFLTPVFLKYSLKKAGIIPQSKE
jgi:hypothetical protein